MLTSIKGPFSTKPADRSQVRTKVVSQTASSFLPLLSVIYLFCKEDSQQSVKYQCNWKQVTQLNTATGATFRQLRQFKFKQQNTNHLKGVAQVYAALKLCWKTHLKRNRPDCYIFERENERRAESNQRKKMNMISAQAILLKKWPSCLCKEG